MSVNLLHFTADWSTECQKSDRIVAQIQSTVNQAELIVQTIDVERNQQAARKHNITTIPSIVFVDEGGVEISRLVGQISHTEILTHISRAQSAETQFQTA